MDLKRLNMSDTAIMDINNLPKSLEWINLKGTRIRNLKPLTKLKHLKEIHADWKKLKDQIALFDKSMIRK